MSFGSSLVDYLESKTPSKIREEAEAIERLLARVREGIVDLIPARCSTMKYGGIRQWNGVRRRSLFCR